MSDTPKEIREEQAVEAAADQHEQEAHDAEAAAEADAGDDAGAPADEPVETGSRDAGSADEAEDGSSEDDGADAQPEAEGLRRVTVARPIARREANVRAASWSEDERTVDLTFATETPVLTFGKTDRGWERFYEILDLSGMDLSRMSNAPVLDSHMSFDLRSVIGRVVEAREDGTATVRISARDDLSGVRQDIADGILSQVSAGYVVRRYTDEGSNGAGVRTLRAVEWMPMEVSLVAIGADPNSQLRSLQKPEQEEAGEAAYDAVIETRAAEDAPAAEALEVEQPAGDPVEILKMAREYGCLDYAEAMLEGRCSVEQAKGRFAQISEIRTACELAGLAERAEDYVARGIGVEAVRAELVEARAKRSDETAVNGEIAPDAGGDQEAAGTGVRIDRRKIFERLDGRASE